LHVSSISLLANFTVCVLSRYFGYVKIVLTLHARL